MSSPTSVMPLTIRILLALLLIAGLSLFLYKIHGVLAPFVLAFVLAYVLAPIIDRLEGSGIGRTSSILLVFLSVFSLLGFGVFAAGNRLTVEVRELTDRMQRNEFTQSLFLVHNKGDAPLFIDGAEWEYVDGKPNQTSFELSDDVILPLEVLPGQKREISLSFMPDSLLFTQTNLRLELGGNRAGQWLVLPVVGNLRHGNERVPSELGLKASEYQIRGVDLEPNWVDMGEAGPNVFTDIGKMAETVQPTLQSYWGDDLDLVTLIKEQGDTLINTLLGSTTVFLGGVVSGLTFVVIVPFVAFFFLKEGRQISRKVIELVPNAYFELCLNLLHQINGQIGGYIRGQILATSVVATLAISGLSIIGLQYAFPVGLLAGFANMIPFLGPLIGIISASIVALATGGTLAMSLVGKVIVIFLVIQIIDNILIQPTVVAKSVEMHPLMVLFVVMVGSQLMGIVGMLIAVPLTGILKVIVQSIYVGIRGYRLQ
jgi:predicted PurR-regulated permease PerM